MTTLRAIRDEVKNVLDYLTSAELALCANEVSISNARISFHLGDHRAGFLLDRRDPRVDHYLHWVKTGAYSAILLDGSLIQMTYDVIAGRVSGHRLAYVPCPYDLDAVLLEGGEPLADIVELYLNDHPALRSPIRFDYDLTSAKPGHPAAHLTLNTANCRIACIAPMHPLRFIDFVFRNFYPDY